MMTINTNDNGLTVSELAQKGMDLTKPLIGEFIAVYDYVVHADIIGCILLAMDNDFNKLLNQHEGALQREAVDYLLSRGFEREHISAIWSENDNNGRDKALHLIKIYENELGLYNND